MINSIKILYGKSRYNVFSAWQKALCKAFLNQGIESEILAAGQDFLFPPEQKTITMGFNLVRKWTVECMDQFHIAWLVDHPAYHPELFSHEISGTPVKMDKLIIGSVDREWVKTAREIYRCTSIHFIPHAAVTEVNISADRSGRDLDVVFFGSIDSLETFETRLQKLSGNFWPVLEKLMHEFSYSVHARLDKLMRDVFVRAGLPPEHAVVAVNAFFSNLDRYHIIKERIKTLRAVKKAKIHLFGNGPWNEMELGDNIIIHDSIPYDEVISVMKRAKLLLNHTPSLQDGGHERIFEALANGCAVLTTPSFYIHSEFGENNGIRFYPGSQADMDELIAAALSDPAAEECITAGQQIVAERHLMRNRAELIAQLAAERWPDVF